MDFIGGPFPNMAVMAACDWRPQIRLGPGVHPLATLIRLVARLYTRQLVEVFALLKCSLVSMMNGKPIANLSLTEAVSKDTEGTTVFRNELLRISQR